MISIRLRELAEKRNGPVVATAIALRVERALFGLARLVPGLDRHATAANAISRALIYVAQELMQLNTRNRLRKRQYVRPNTRTAACTAKRNTIT